MAIERAREAFNAQLKRLIGLKFAPASLDTHWEALQDVPLVVLTAAVTRGQKTRAEFPSPVELRQDADQVAHLVRESVPEPERITPLETPKELAFPLAKTTLRVTAEWSYYDDRCSDTGWQSVWCGNPQDVTRKPWMEPRTCERRGVHGAHEWVRQCNCFESNPALIRKRDAQRKYAEQAATKR